MPYINVKSNKKISEDQEQKIKEILGMCISLIPGKSENWLMVDIEGDKNLYFKGDKNTPAIFIDFKILGSLDKSMCKKLSEVMCKKIGDILGVAPINIFICFMGTENWGWSSSTI